jgi:Zn-dependent protease with chaperone function
MILAVFVQPAIASQWSPEYEKKAGEETVAEVEKQWKVYEDKAALQKLNDIVTEIVKHTPRPDVKYTIKLLDTPEENAFSVPGGWIYVTKGLLKDVQSDDELAGVLAHEIGHNCTYDALDGAEKSSKLEMGSVGALLAAVLMGAKADMIAGVYAAGQMYARGVLSGYSIDIETRADRNGMKFMLDSKYNPVGLLTFMERLAADERSRPSFDLGVFQDHPVSTERVRLLIGYLNDAGVDINRRATTKWEKPIAEEVKIGDRPGLRVKLWGETILETTSAAGEASLKARGDKIVQALTNALAAGIEAYEVRTGAKNGQPVVIARDMVIFPVVPEDAVAGAAADDVAQQASQGIKQALYKEELGRNFAAKPPEKPADKTGNKPADKAGDKPSDSAPPK